MLPIRDSVLRLRTPVVTWTLIALNAAVFLYELTLSPGALDQLIAQYGLLPARYSSAKAVPGLDPENFWPFWTNMFLHAGFLHILSNMWTLWLFGGTLEDRMGRPRFLFFYLLCGLSASLVHFAFNLQSSLPALGASGAIAGVMGAYLVLYPRASITVLFPVLFIPLFFDLPAIFYLGFWFLIQFFSGTASIVNPQHGGGIAWWAHIGGFSAGIVWVALLHSKEKNIYRHFTRQAFRPRWGRWHG